MNQKTKSQSFLSVMFGGEEVGGYLTAAQHFATKKGYRQSYGIDRNGPLEMKGLNLIYRYVVCSMMYARMRACVYVFVNWNRPFEKVN